MNRRGLIQDRPAEDRCADWIISRTWLTGKIGHHGLAAII